MIGPPGDSTLANNSQVVPSNGSGLVTPMNGPDSMSMVNMPTTGGGMRGIGLVALILSQVALKLETVNIAKDYYKQNKKDFDNFKATHQSGAVQSVSEAMSEITNPKYTPDEYASVPAGISKAKIVEQAWFAARRRTHRYATGAQQRLDYDFAVLKVSAVATGWNAGRRYEQAWADGHNERRFNRKMVMANLGIAQGNIVKQGLSTAVGNVSKAYSGLSSEIGSIGNGYFKKQGYEDGRREQREQINRDRN